MNGEMNCEQVREVIPELAIGIADGQERDAALRHAAACPDCRKLISELSSVVDDLLLLAPQREPSPGFAAATVARMYPSAARMHPPAARHVRARRAWLPRLAVAASIVAALGVGAGAVYQGTASDRQLAGSYRTVLGEGHGSFFAAAPLRGPTGTVGTVFGYQGHPSWLFATVHLPGSGTQRFAVEMITRDGRRLPVGTAILGGTHGTWGAQISMDLSELAQLRFVAPSGHTAMVANVNARSPWGSG
jgi:hypothetical protein